MISGGHFGVVGTCWVFLSLGRLLCGFSLCFATSSFLRLCEGDSVSMASSASKQAKNVASAMLVFGLAASGLCLAGRRALCFGLLSPGRCRNLLLPRRSRENLLLARLGVVDASLSGLSTAPLLCDRVPVNTSFTTLSGSRLSFLMLASGRFVYVMKSAVSTGGSSESFGGLGGRVERGDTTQICLSRRVEEGFNQQIWRGLISGVRRGSIRPCWPSWRRRRRSLSRWT